MNKDSTKVIPSGSKSPSFGQNKPEPSQRTKGYVSSPLTSSDSKQVNFASEGRPSMNPKDVFAKALDQATRSVKHFELELDNPTPCTDWNVRQLLNHMVYELMWVPELLHGKTVTEVGTKYEHDLLGTDPKSAWYHAADAALLSVNHSNGSDTVHVSYGDIPTAEYIEEVARDMFIHTWDLCQGMHSTLMLQEDVAHAIYDHDIDHKDELSKDGLFADAIDVPKDARFQTQFLALYGRQEPSASHAS